MSIAATEALHQRARAHLHLPKFRWKFQVKDDVTRTYNYEHKGTLHYNTLVELRRCCCTTVRNDSGNSGWASWTCCRSPTLPLPLPLAALTAEASASPRGTPAVAAGAGSGKTSMTAIATAATSATRGTAPAAAAAVVTVAAAARTPSSSAGGSLVGAKPNSTRCAADMLPSSPHALCMPAMPLPLPLLSLLLLLW